MIKRVSFIISLLVIPTLTYSEAIHFAGKFVCDELSAKSFSVNNEVHNVKLDGEGLHVEMKVEGKSCARSENCRSYLETSFPSIGMTTEYEGVVTLMNKDRNGNQIVNAQYVATDGGIFGTKTVTITYQQSTGNWFMIQTEPFALGTDYPAIRTHFHRCTQVARF